MCKKLFLAYNQGQLFCILVSRCAGQRSNKEETCDMAILFLEIFGESVFID